MDTCKSSKTTHTHRRKQTQAESHAYYPGAEKSTYVFSSSAGSDTVRAAPPATAAATQLPVPLERRTECGSSGYPHSLAHTLTTLTHAHTHRPPRYYPNRVLWAKHTAAEHKCVEWNYLFLGEGRLGGCRRCGNKNGQPSGLIYRYKCLSSSDANAVRDLCVRALHLLSLGSFAHPHLHNHTHIHTSRLKHATRRTHTQETHNPDTSTQGGRRTHSKSVPTTRLPFERSKHTHSTRALAYAFWRGVG